jgi:filamentous hemagglutinin family protein
MSWKISAIAALVLMSGMECAIAQITVDSTLSNERSQVVPLDDQGLLVDLIQGGAIRGTNLFHSFLRFNVAEGRGVYFARPSDTQNILARVTGREPSQILGTLGIVPLAGNAAKPNLFLINPNGILFGANASLSLPGSFFATTANAIQLGSTGLFSASQPESSNLLAIEPSAFLFNAIAVQPIINQSQARSTIFGDLALGLSTVGRDIFLVGGDIKLEGGEIYALGGQVALASIQGTGSAELIKDQSRFTLKIPDSVQRGDISLSEQAALYVRSSRGGGEINISARNLQVSGESDIYAGIFKNSGVVEKKAGNITIDATDMVKLTGNSYVTNSLESGSIGELGDINIKTQVLDISDRAQISNVVEGQGKAGNINIQAAQAVLLKDSLERLNQATIGTAILNRVEPNAVGNAGKIQIRTPFLSLLEGAQISASLFGQGKAGVVDLDVDNTIIMNPGLILSSIDSGGEGEGGQINVKTGSLSLLSGSQLLTIVRGTTRGGRPASGNAGSINVNARNQILISGLSPAKNQILPLVSAIASSIDAGATGKAGDITVQAGTLVLKDFGQIRATLDPNATGQAGNIQVDAKNASITRGGLIIAATAGQGNAGNVLLRIQDNLTFDRAGGDQPGVLTNVLDNSTGGGGNLTIFAKTVLLNDAGLSTQTFSTKNAGNVVIDADQLTLQPNSFISTSTDGLGNAGNILIRAPQSVQLFGGENASYITTSTGSTGKGGDLEINTGKLLLQDGAYISTGALEGSQGRSGDIKITASNRVEVVGTTRDSQSASKLGTVTEGSGDSGNLNIETQQLLVREGGSVSTETQGSGRGGNLRINATESVEVAGGASNGAFVSAITSETEQSGNAGNLDITTRRLLIKDGAYVSAEARDSSTGSPGNVTINAVDSINIVGKSRNDSSSRISASVQSDFFRRVLSGEQIKPDNRVSGNVTLSTQQLRLDQGEISTIAQGLSRAGDITLNVGDRLEMQDSSILSSAFFTSGGNIQIAANRVRLRGVSEIGSQVLFGFLNEDLSALGISPGAGGNLKITAQSIIALERSDIFTFNQGGKGGNIIFDTRAFFGQNYRPSAPGTDPVSLKENNRVDINASGAVSGVITLPDTTFIQNSLNQLPQTAIDTNTLLANSCIVRNQQNGSFYITGTGGLPTNPSELSTYSTGTIQPTSASVWKPGDAIVEPQGVYQLPNGSLILSRECN